MTVVSYSEVSIFQYCTRRFYYQFGLGLRPIEQGKAIGTGVEGHTFLERFYKKLQSGATQADALDFMFEHNPKNTISGEKLKAYTIASGYARDLKLQGEPWAVEQPVIVKPTEHISHGVLGINDLYIGFTPDLVWEKPNGFLEVEDYKFSGRDWNPKKVSHYRQLNIYNALLREQGHNVSRGILRLFNTTTGQNREIIFDPSIKELTILKSEFVRAALQVKEFKELPITEQREIAIRTLNYQSCGFCPYTFPCSLEAQGKDATRTLETQFTHSDYGYIWPGGSDDRSQD